MVFDPVSPVRAEEVEAKAVVIEIADLEESVLELGPLPRVDKALEYRVLNALAVVQARLRNAIEAALPSFG